MKKKFFFLVTISIFLIGTSGIAIAQTLTDTELIDTGMEGYFVNLNGNLTGPYTEHGLRELVRLGFLTQDTMVWKKGMPVWVLAGEIGELSFLFSITMPVPSETTPVPSELPSDLIPEQTLPLVYELVPEPDPLPYQQVLIPLSFENEYTDFSAGQRWGTFGLNFLIPGLGSFAVMRDVGGGFVNLSLGLAGYAAGAVGTMMILDEKRDLGYGLVAAGAALYLASFIQNIVRSSTHHRPRPKISLFDLEAWNIAMVPGKNGIESVALSYTVRR